MRHDMSKGILDATGLRTSVEAVDGDNPVISSIQLRKLFGLSGRFADAFLEDGPTLEECPTLTQAIEETARLIRALAFAGLSLLEHTEDADASELNRLRIENHNLRVSLEALS